jgi:hypothetical protein
MADGGDEFLREDCAALLRNNYATESTTQSLPWKESIGLCSQLPANNMKSELGRWVLLQNCEIRDKRNVKHFNWTWISGKKKAKDAAIFMLVAFVAILTFIVLMAIFRVCMSARSILAALGRESQSVKEPSDWYRVAAI